MTAPIEELETTEEERASFHAVKDVSFFARVIRDFDRLLAHANAETARADKASTDRARYFTEQAVTEARAERAEADLAAESARADAADADTSEAAALADTNFRRAKVAEARANAETARADAFKEQWLLRKFDLVTAVDRAERAEAALRKICVAYNAEDYDYILKLANAALARDMTEDGPTDANR